MSEQPLNHALPAASLTAQRHYLSQCKNLSLILDKFAPWGIDRGTWDLRMNESIRRGGQDTIQIVSGGQVKGLWLSTFREARNGESESVFEDQRYDLALVDAYQRRWVDHIKDSHGWAFEMRLSERIVAGLGASSVLETSLTLDRNTGLPYLPGSSVKGIARAWGLIEVAAKFGITLESTLIMNNKQVTALTALSEGLIVGDKAKSDEKLGNIVQALGLEPSKDVADYVDYFRFIFGSQGNAGAVAFLDAIYHGQGKPEFISDVMTPHYPNYFNESGGSPPAEDDNPNPVSFLTVKEGNVFAFGLLSRLSAYEKASIEPREVLEVAKAWLIKGLASLGAGAKTAAGYGFFSRKSAKMIVGE